MFSFITYLLMFSLLKTFLWLPLLSDVTDTGVDNGD